MASVLTHGGETVAVPTMDEFAALLVRVATLEAHVKPEPLPAAVPTPAEPDPGEQA